MTTSRFQQLEQILNEDSKNTYNYLDKNFTFIRQFAQKLADYLGCNPNKIFCLDSEWNKTHVQNSIQDLITVDNKCFFHFQLLISIVDSAFNINNSGKSFFEKGLASPLGVVLVVAVKQQGDSFLVKAPAIAEEQVVEKEILINPGVDDSWIELLESCFQVMKKTLEGGLEERISKLGNKTDNASQKALGFHY